MFEREEMTTEEHFCWITAIMCALTLAIFITAVRPPMPL